MRSRRLLGVGQQRSQASSRVPGVVQRHLQAQGPRAIAGLAFDLNGHSSEILDVVDGGVV